MARGHLVIVTRRDPSLYTYLEETFHDVAGVLVIHDRRTTPLDAPTPTVERRRRPEVATQICVYGYAVVAQGGFDVQHP
jgi:hypothetical protein